MSLKNKRITLSLLIVFTLSIIVIIFFSYDKKEETQYSLKTPEALAIYIYNEKTQKYERKSEVPHGYELNVSKSYCKSGGEVVNYDSYYEYVNYALATDDRCYLYFDVYLPEGYTKLEYIESTGTQYIDTGYAPNEKTKVEAEAIFPVTSATQVLFGGRPSWDKSSITFFAINGGYRADHNTVQNSTSKVNSDWYTHVIIDTTSATVNNQSTATYSNAAFQSPNSITIFAVNENAGVTYNSSAKLFYFKVYEENELIHSFVPCLNEGGKAGLYDQIGKTFHGNLGSDEFLYEISGDELPSDYTQLEYIESTGTQYIDTGFIPNQDTRVVAEMEFVVHSNADCGLFGQRTPGGTNQFEYLYWNGKHWFSYGSYQYSATGSSPVGQRMLIDFSKDSATVDVSGTIVSVTPTVVETFTGYTTLKLYALDRNGISYNSISRIYLFKIFDNGNLVRNYIPALNKQGVPGLYDTVEDKFYTNAGTGQFKYHVNNNRLPQGYIAVPYIESVPDSGKQHIDTGYKPNHKTTIETVVKFPIVATQFLFGARQAHTTNTFSFLSADFSGSYRVDHNNVQQNINAGTSDYYHITMGPTKTTANGTSVSYGDTAFQSPVNLYLFAVNTNGTTEMNANAKMYYFKIYEGDVLVRDFVPCINPYGEVGMYDLVNDRFYGNAGTGTLRAGVPDGYASVNYLQSSGTQYINTGYYASNNTMIDVVASYTGGYSIYGGTSAFMNFTANSAGGYFYYDGYTNSGGQGASAVSDLKNVVHSFKQDNNIAYIDNSIFHTFNSSTFTDTLPLFLFGRNANGALGDAGGNVTIYSAKIWDKYKLVRYFVPCQDSSGTLGMYDLVNDKFYTNAGSGTFASG